MRQTGKCLLKSAVAAVAVAGACFAMSGAALGQSVKPVGDLADSATTIIVGRLDQYIAEPEPLDRFVEGKLKASNVIMGNDEAVYLMTVQPRGTYVFHVERVIKGNPPETLIVRLPRVMNIGHERGLLSQKMRVPLKGDYLLTLSGDEKSGFVPVAQSPIPISVKGKGPAAPGGGEEAASAAKPADAREAVQVFLDSLDDSKTRDVAAFMLAQTKDERVLPFMQAHADDKDEDLRASVLECLAVNQDVWAIPKIAGWSYGDRGSGGNPVLSVLTQYTTPKAIPELNKLVIDQRSPDIRLYAVMALQKLPPDASSIPFLIKALRDPGEQLTHTLAWQGISRCAPELNLQPANINRPISDDDIKAIEGWWAAKQGHV